MADERCEEQDRAFERALERLYAEAPVFDDRDAFAGRVESELTRNWRIRNLGIATAGVLGGLVAASQLVGSGLAVRVEHASTQSVQAVDALYHGASAGLDVLSHIAPSAGLFWVVSGLLVIAAVIGATRVLDEV